MNITLIILISLAASAFGVWLYFYLRDLNEKQRIWRSLDANAGIGKQFSNFKKKYVTPGGARVRSTVAIPDNFIAAIDTAINNQFALYATRFPGWAKYNDHRHYYHGLLWRNPKRNRYQYPSNWYKHRICSWKQHPRQDRHIR